MAYYNFIKINFIINFEYYNIIQEHFKGFMMIMVL
jgi:hypothetical protein